MATTTFCDIKLSEDVESYRYEKQDYSWSEGDVVSLPYHTANRFVNNWERAEWAKSPYEVKTEDYDYVVGRVRNSDDVDTCSVEKADGEICGREKPCSYHGDEE